MVLKLRMRLSRGCGLVENLGYVEIEVESKVEK